MSACSPAFAEHRDIEKITEVYDFNAYTSVSLCSAKNTSYGGYNVKVPFALCLRRI